ncbi:MFS transporter [Aurantivibrio plasticivorans]
MSALPQLRLYEKFAYGSGEVAENIKNYAISLFILFYYNQLLGLSGSLVGISLLIALSVDAITDPLTGAISDRWQSRWGRRHPFMLLSILPLGITFYLLFAPPEGLSQWGLFVWLTVFGIAVRFALTLFHVPYMALGTELVHGYTERTVVAQFRFGMGTFGQLAVYALAFLVFFTGAKGQWQATAYPPYAASLALMSVAVMLSTTLGTKRFIPYLPTQKRQDKASVVGLFKDWSGGFANASFRWYISGMLVLYIMVGVDASLMLYVGSYIWELDSIQLFIYSTATVVGYVFGSLFTKRLHHRFDKKPILMFGVASWAIWQIIPVTAYLVDLMPAPGTATIVLVLSAMRIIQSAGTVQALVTGTSMMADIADQHELNTGHRAEGIFFGTLSFAKKATSGFGKFAAGVALDLIAWPTGSNIAPADVPRETLVWLALLYGPIVSAFFLVSLWCISRYTITRFVHENIMQKLKERRQSML